MENIFPIILILHIIAGTLALLLGTLNILRKKGDTIHKKAGIVFVVAMISTGLSSLILATINPNIFLFTVGIFTIYLAGTGYFYLRYSINIYRTGIIFLSSFLFLGALFFLYTGIKFLLASEVFGLVFLFFGVISARFLATDFLFIKNKTITDYSAALRQHIQRIVAAYISAFTAFLVVNNGYMDFIPPFLIWLLPSVIFTPVIIYWSKKYKAA